MIKVLAGINESSFIPGISYFANICKFYVRMRSCNKQASRLANKLPVCVQYNAIQ